MTREDPLSRRGRVSQYAPSFMSPSQQVWEEALRDPATKSALDEGLADLKAGRTKPWAEVRKTMSRR